MSLYQMIFGKFGRPSSEKISELSSKSEINNLSDEYICGISFVINKNNAMEITCMIPKDLEQLDAYGIAEAAEKYAELLVYINKGLFKNEINDILSKTPSLENENSVLFIQNVKNFYEMHNSEISKILKNNRPLISPSSVFRI